MITVKWWWFFCFQIIFETRTEAGYEGDIALDDVRVFEGKCEGARSYDEINGITALAAIDQPQSFKAPWSPHDGWKQNRWLHTPSVFAKTELLGKWRHGHEHGQRFTKWLFIRRCNILNVSTRTQASLSRLTAKTLVDLFRKLYSILLFMSDSIFREFLYFICPNVCACSAWIGTDGWAPTGVGTDE